MTPFTLCTAIWSIVNIQIWFSAALNLIQQTSGFAYHIYLTPHFIYSVDNLMDFFSFLYHSGHPFVSIQNDTVFITSSFIKIQYLFLRPQVFAAVHQPGQVQKPSNTKTFFKRALDLYSLYKVKIKNTSKNLDALGKWSANSMCKLYMISSDCNALQLAKTLVWL